MITRGTTEHQVVMVVIDDDIDHIMCCKDEDVLLCGEDGRGMEIREVRHPCAMCERNVDNHLCPLVGICTEPNYGESN